MAAWMILDHLLATGMLWERGCTPDRAAEPTVAAFGHRQRRCDDMLAAVFRKLLSGECTTSYDHGRLHVCSGHLRATA